MNKTDKIILFFILVFFFLSLTLFFPRHDTPIYRLFDTTHLKEGFDDASLPGIDSVIPERENLPLSQYVIKASYLSAFDGKTMSLDQLRFVLQRGCRFLDLEIFSTSENIPYLGYSIDPTFTIVKGVDPDPDKLVYFDQALTTITTNCFSSLSPNFKDPLFIHLRIKSRKREVYEIISQIIQNKVSAKLYKGANGKLKSVHKDTLLKDIMGKIIFVMDHTIDPQYNLVLGCDSSGNDFLDGSGNELLPCLKNVVNIQSGGTQWRTIEYNPPDKNTELGKCGMAASILDETNKNMTVVKADDSPIQLFYVAPPIRSQFENPDPLSMGIYIAEFICQTIPFMFFKDDIHLNTYEKLFQTYHTAFIPMGYAVSHIRQNNDGNGIHI